MADEVARQGIWYDSHLHWRYRKDLENVTFKLDLLSKEGLKRGWKVRWDVPDRKQDDVPDRNRTYEGEEHLEGRLRPDSRGL